MPQLFQGFAARGIGHRRIARQAIRQHAHVAHALEIILFREREQSGPGTTQVPRQERKIHDGPDAVAPAGLDAGGIEQGSGACAGVGAGGAFNQVGGDAAKLGGGEQVVLAEGFDEGFEIAAMALDEATVVQSAIENDFGHGPIQHDLGAGANLEKEIGGFGQPMAPGIDDDQFRAGEFGAQHPAAHGGQLPAQIHAIHDDRLAPVEFADGIRGGGHAEHVEQDMDAVVAVDAAAMVDVVGAEHRPGEFLEQVAFLVGTAGRGQEREGLGSMPLPDRLKPFRQVIESCFPRHRNKTTVATHQRRPQSVAGTGHLVDVPAADADPALVRGV